MRTFFSGLTLALCLSVAMPSPGRAAAAVTVKPGNVALHDLTETGGKLVAVGERGTILFSADQGRTWEATFGPTTRTLLSVAFLDQRNGVAVGHGGTILRSEDGGLVWQAVRVPEAGQDAILGVTALSDGRLVACGAFGMFLQSSDGGKSWSRSQVLGEDFDRHISKIIEVDAGRLLLVAETGTIALSDDGGATWRLVKSPYEGSYFGALKLADGSLLIYGMRGNVYRSTDRGESWSHTPFNSKAAINGGSVAADGRVILVGNAGLVAVSADGGQTFSLRTTADARPLAQARIADGTIVYVGFLSNGRMDANTK